MKLSDNAEKQRSLELAEESREKEWLHPSFVAELFKGAFRWDLVHPFPVQSTEDKRLGDDYLEKLERCVKEHIDPDEVDRTYQIPEKAMQALADLGCFGMKIPKEYGGLGFSQINYSRAIALVGSYCPSTAVLLSAHQSIGVPQPLKLFGNKQQKEKYLPRLAKGAISAFALTEPEVGSDPARMRTEATPSADGSHYTINGLKMWCTNGPIADILVVMARTPPKIVKGKEKKQITAFIVESSMPGFEVEHVCSFQGLHGIMNGVIRFDNVKVPVENVIGEPGMGLKIALVTLNGGRLALPAASSAVNKLCLRFSRKWAAERTQWGQAIGKHQAIADKLAKMAATTFATESVTWLASAFADQGRMDIRLEAAMAKYFCTEAAWQVVDDALQIRGGRGYENAESLKAHGEDPMPIERIQRDIRINRIIEGTSEIMGLFIAREAMDMHFRNLMPLMDDRKDIAAKLKQALKTVGFYSVWYSKQWIYLPHANGTAHLSAVNRRHLTFIERSAKKLARRLFHVIARYQQKLEKEQLILFRFVDIGTLLFAMAACLSMAEQKMTEDGQGPAAQELADLFCRDARKRIQRLFRETKTYPKLAIANVGEGVLAGRYAWVETDIVDL